MKALLATNCQPSTTNYKMNYLQAENIAKSFGIKPLFTNLTIGINKGQRVALVARNGSGKSTLLKILAGKETADAGQVTQRKDIRIEFLDQDPKLDPEKTIIEALLATESPIFNAVREYEKALEGQHAEDNDITRKVLQMASERMDAMQAWDIDAKLHSLLSKFSIDRVNVQIKTLSGGQLKRVAMCSVLIDEPDLLILDEPTNHLDIDMIEWLEDYLSTSNMTLLMVTHDRYFLDSVCNEVIELEDGELFKYKGTYSYYLEKKAERELSEQKSLEKAKNLFSRELEWMRRQPKARTTKSKSRVDAFDDVSKNASKRLDEDNVELSVKMTRIGGKILELKKIYKNYGDLTLLKGFDYTFKRGERLGIVGKNGAGKSTLLNIIAGLEEPDSGKVNIGETIVLGYYSQKGMKFKEDKRMIEVVKDIADVIPMADGSRLSAAQLLNRFLFPNETHYTQVSKLSGGEKRRLYLLTILIKNPNLLILDEPTNDLDIVTLNVLEDFLSEFGGVLIIVSHDRYFMDRLADHLFVFEGDGVIRDFNGNYTDYRNDLLEREKAARKLANEASNAAKKAAQDALVKPKIKLSFKDKYELEQLDKELPQLEKERAELEAKMVTLTDHEEIMKTSARIGEIIAALDTKGLRWLELTELAG